VVDKTVCVERFLYRVSQRAAAYNVWDSATIGVRRRCCRLKATVKVRVNAQHSVGGAPSASSDVVRVSAECQQAADGRVYPEVESATVLVGQLAEPCRILLKPPLVKLGPATGAAGLVAAAMQHGVGNVKQIVHAFVLAGASSKLVSKPEQFHGV